MNIVRGILAIIVGIIVGGLVNFGLIMLGYKFVPLPAGANTMDIESMKAAMQLFQTKHFIMPFIGHAIGTLVGAFLAAKIAASRKMIFAFVVGLWFLLGGIYAAIIFPAPMWFIVLDLVVAYIPMAWLGGKLGSGSGSKAATVETDGTEVGN